MSENMNEHTQRPASTAESAPFRAVLTPNRALSRTGFILVMALIGGISFIAGMAFLIMGAWPVFGFFGLDVFLVYWAFKRNYRDGRASEAIEVTPHRVHLVRTDPSGRQTSAEFNTYWVRLALKERSDGRSYLDLVARGETTRIADFLSDDERRAFADVLDRELLRARTQTGF